MLTTSALFCDHPLPPCIKPSLAQCQQCKNGKSRILACDEILRLQDKIKYIETSNFSVKKFFSLTPLALQTFANLQEYSQWLNLPLDIREGQSLMALINNEDIIGVIISEGLLKQRLLEKNATLLINLNASHGYLSELKRFGA